MGYVGAMTNTKVEDTTSKAVETTRIEDGAYAAFVQRVVKGLGKRAMSNPAALSVLAEVARFVDELTIEAVHELRQGPTMASWVQIGDALGITRQAAHARFGGPGGRQAGGQPGGLR